MDNQEPKDPPNLIVIDLSDLCEGTRFPGASVANARMYTDLGIPFVLITRSLGEPDSVSYSREARRREFRELYGRFLEIDAELGVNEPTDRIISGGDRRLSSASRRRTRSQGSQER